MSFSASIEAITAKRLVASIERGGATPIFAGKLAANEVRAPVQLDLAWLNKLWYDVPEPIRFFVSGNLGNICFFGIERIVHAIICKISSRPPFVEEHKDSISFFLGYILQIVTQHLLHAWLVYGLSTIDTRQKYLSTLIGQSWAYFVALVGSTILNTWLRRSGMPKDLAFVTTLVVFACINYFVIGWIVHKTVADAENNHHLKSKANAGKKKAEKLTKRFSRGGAMVSSLCVNTMVVCSSCQESSVLGFVLSTADSVPPSRSTHVSLSKYMMPQS